MTIIPQFWNRKPTYEGDFLVGHRFERRGDISDPTRITHTEYEIPNAHDIWDHDRETRVRSLKQGSGAAFIHEGSKDIVVGDKLIVVLGRHMNCPNKVYIDCNGKLSYENIGNKRLPELLKFELIEPSILRIDPEGLNLYDKLLQEQFDIYFENWRKKVVDIQTNQERLIRMFYIIPPEKYDEFQKVFTSAERIPKTFSELESMAHDPQLPAINHLLPIDYCREIFGENQMRSIKQHEARWKFRNIQDLNEAIREEYLNFFEGLRDQIEPEKHSPVIAEKLNIKYPQLQERLGTFNR